MRYLIDTCIFIDHLRGYPPASQWLKTNLAQNDLNVCYPAIVVAELFAGLSPRHYEEIMALLSIMECVDINKEIAQRAGEYVQKWGPTHGVEIPDALVAATAQYTSFLLVTRNRRHYPMEGIEILIPY